MLLVVSVVLALLAYFVRPIRFFVASIALICSGAANGLLFSDHATIWGCLSLCFGVYQLFNIARLIKSRLHARYLRNAFLIGGARLLGLQLIMLLMSVISLRYESFDSRSVLAIRWIQVGVALVISSTVILRLIRSRPARNTTYYSDNELPSISVLIPARNEDKNLEELLRTVVANDYPKLEIIVLDDNSNSQRISEIVKGFAHDGVRFVQGDGPKDDWLAKNQAYETLADNASGEYMVFMGVDVRLAVTSLRSLIEYSLSTKKDMVSVLPTRYDPAFWKGFFSPLRYFRELSKISPAVGGTPTLSTLWVIKKSAFDHVGGFGAATRTVIPERFFAKELSRTKQYAFIRSSSRLQVATAKAVSEQIDTSIRVSYPAQHRRLEANALSNIGMFVFMFLPFVQFIHAVIGKQYINALLSGIAAALLAVAHLAIVTTTNPILWPLAVINMPYLVLQEIALCALSMYRYEFGEVIWKGRGISQPVMQVIPHLPSIDSGDGRP